MSFAWQLKAHEVIIVALVNYIYVQCTCVQEPQNSTIMAASKRLIRGNDLVILSCTKEAGRSHGYCS